MTISHEWLAENAARISRLILIKAPGQIIANDLGLLVARLRKEYGREVVDAKIDQFQKQFDARDAGMCDQCLERPAVGGDGMDMYHCIECETKIQKENKEMEIMDAMEMKPINDPDVPS